MKVVSIDVWGDGEDCLFVQDHPHLDAIVAEWRELDKGYASQVVTDGEWIGISDYLKWRGIKMLQSRVIVL